MCSLNAFEIHTIICLGNVIESDIKIMKIIEKITI